MRNRTSRNGSDRRERAMVIGTVGILALVVLLGRLVQLQVFASQTSRDRAEQNWLRPEYLPGPRGRILDRNQVVLADERPSFSIVIDPNIEAFLRDRDALDRSVDNLARLIDGDRNKYHEDIKRNRSRSYKAVRLERNADSSMVARVEEHRSMLPGVSVEVESERFYPADTLACHVLGYVGEIDEEDLEQLKGSGYRLGSLLGKSGIERQYEDQLRGEDGIRYVEVNAMGRRSEAFLKTEPIPPRPGRDLILTLDARLQHVAEQALLHADYEGEGDHPEVRGAAILLDVWSGDVLAMASRPAFDANVFTGRLSPEVWADLNRAGDPLLNRAIQSTYPPGSVFKPLTAYAGLAHGDILPATTYATCTGRYPYGNAVKRCWKRTGHGTLNIYGALANSCDVYFYQVATSLGVDGIARYARLFGIDERTGIDLPQERKGLVPDGAWYDENFGVRKWSRGVALNLIIGQGEVHLTPIELAQHTALLATGNRRVSPRLLHDLGPEHRLGSYAEAQTEPAFATVILDSKPLAVVREGMVLTVTEGTGKRAVVPGITLAGKTGTAENSGEDHAVFIGYAPAENPQVAVVVYLENRGHGGALAAPVAREILAAYFLPDSTLAPEGEE